jgi:predicted enzyme related to lactoylglutathione lyase
VRPRLELTLDCNDLERMAGFWSAALGYRRAPVTSAGYVGLEPPDGDGIPLTLQQVPEVKRAKNRLHLDLLVTDLEAELARLESIGARRLEDHTGYGMRWAVLADPEGNEFCVATEA